MSENRTNSLKSHLKNTKKKSTNIIIRYFISQFSLYIIPDVVISINSSGKIILPLIIYKMQPLNTFDTKALVDYDNLNITTLPRPPRRRQSGKSLVPFRPYVKRLTSIRQPYSFTNGYDKWKIQGKDEIFFTQQNARCIGSLIDDCDISDVIRWDIEGESTRLPMMCKLWMIGKEEIFLKTNIFE
jgi:hypothetical protein